MTGSMCPEPARGQFDSFSPPLHQIRYPTQQTSRRRRPAESDSLTLPLGLLVTVFFSLYRHYCKDNNKHPASLSAVLPISSQGEYRGAKALLMHRKRQKMLHLSRSVYLCVQQFSCSFLCLANLPAAMHQSFSF